MKCRYCEKEALPDKSICGDERCLHYLLVERREAWEVARAYPELAKRAGIELPPRLSEEELLKQLGF
ncbi:MAG: hypothetical protein FVQ79_04170 [Planctomycetes bacterium]|nr:hypothetical protein [Planctomycetota bacterium]